MSSDHPSAAPSRAAETPSDESLELASLVRLRGLALIEALDAHLPGAREHADATGSYAFAAAAKLGLGRPRAEVIREAAKLHDVGLVYIGTETLGKPVEQLDEDERGALALHSETGAQLAHGAGIPDQVGEWIRRWPERVDGSGPAGLAGDEIPLESRIIHAACRCDAALAAPAGEGSRYEAAAKRLRDLGGSAIDAEVAGALAAIMDRAAANR